MQVTRTEEIPTINWGTIVGKEEPSCVAGARAHPKEPEDKQGQDGNLEGVTRGQLTLFRLSYLESFRAQ